MSPERALDSRAKAPPTKRSEKGYGDENGEQFGSFQKFASSSLSVLNILSMGFQAARTVCGREFLVGILIS